MKSPFYTDDVTLQGSFECDWLFLSREKLGPAHTTPGEILKFSLGLLSIQICHESAVFRKVLLKPEEFENAGFALSC